MSQTRVTRMRSPSLLMLAIFTISLFATLALNLISTDVVYGAPFDVDREQFAVADTNSPTATFGTTPKEGSLLVAIAFSRTGTSASSLVISGSDWVKRVERDTNLANPNARRAMAIWTKIAGPAEPTDIQVAGDPGTVKLLTQEFTTPALGSFIFLGSADNDNGTTTDAGSLSTGTTGAAPANSLVITALGVRNAQNVNINAVNWSNGVSDPVVSNGGTFGRTVSSGFVVDPAASDKESTASWAGDNTGASAAILVFQAPDMCQIPDQADRVLVDFAPYEFIRSDQNEAAATHGPFAINLPAGKYKVTLQSWDDHTNKVGPAQPNESYFVILRDAANAEVAQSNPMSDLPENEDFLVEEVNTELEVSAAATTVTAFHSVYPDASSPNSIYPICAAFDPVPDTPDKPDTPTNGGSTQGVTTQVVAPVSGVDAGGGGGSAASTSAVLGLVASLLATGYGIVRFRNQQN